MSAKRGEGMVKGGGGRGKARKMENVRAAQMKLWKRGTGGGFHQHFRAIAKGKLKTETATEALFHTHPHTHPMENTAESEKTSGFLMSQVANTWNTHRTALRTFIQLEIACYKHISIKY